MDSQEIQIDMKCSNTNRVTFVSYDSDILVKDVSGIAPLEMEGCPINGSEICNIEIIFLHDYVEKLGQKAALKKPLMNRYNEFPFDNLPRNPNDKVWHSNNFMQLSVFHGGKLISLNEGERNSHLTYLALQLRVIHPNREHEYYLEFLKYLNNLLCQKPFSVK